MPQLDLLLVVEVELVVIEIHMLLKHQVDLVVAQKQKQVE